MTENLQETVFQKTMRGMANLPEEIRWFGDPILRKLARPYSQEELNTQAATDLIFKMVAVLKETNKCVGLGRGFAAPQIGISRRIFVTFDKSSGGWQAYLNPHITAMSNEVGIYPEMCISGLPIAGKVIRPWEIEFEYYDKSGKYHKTAVDPMLSRIVQHEIDHLDGILFIDRIEIESLSLEHDFEAYKANAKLEKCQNNGCIINTESEEKINGRLREVTIQVRESTIVE